MTLGPASPPAQNQITPIVPSATLSRRHLASCEARYRTAVRICPSWTCRRRTMQPPSLTRPLFVRARLHWMRRLCEYCATELSRCTPELCTDTQGRFLFTHARDPGTTGTLVPAHPHW